MESLSKDKIPSNVRLEKNLSWTKRLKVQMWDDQVRVDIRTYEDGFQRPLKKGVSLTLPRYKTLAQHYDLLTEALEKSEKKRTRSQSELPPRRRGLRRGQPRMVVCGSETVLSTR